MSKFKQSIPVSQPRQFAQFGFWDEALLIETDPPTEEPPKDPPKEEPKPTQEALEVPDFKQMIEDAFKNWAATMKPTEEPKKEEPPKEEPKQEPVDLGPLNTMLRELLVENYKVPEELKSLVPEDPMKAKEFLSSDSFKNLKQKLDLVSKPLTDETKKEEESKPDPDRKAPEDTKPKTFEDITSAYLSDALKGVI